MCVLYVSFGSKVKHRSFGCVAMGIAISCILRSRLLVYFVGSVYVGMVVYISWLHSCLCVWM